LAQIKAAAVASRSRMPPAASILAKRAKGLVITSMGGLERDRRSVDKGNVTSRICWFSRA
jgi:hypothetical protein